MGALAAKRAVPFGIYVEVGVHQGLVEQVAVMQAEGVENNVRIFGMLLS